MNKKHLSIAIFLLLIGLGSLFYVVRLGFTPFPTGPVICVFLFFGLGLMFLRHLKD